MVLEDAMVLFGFKPGSIQSRSSVLKVYRRLLFKFHPDHGGDADDFRKLTDAFNLLAKVFKDIGVVGSDDVVTICGRPLCDLGKGYPITEPACTCDECDGGGYRKYSGLKEGTGEYKSYGECGGEVSRTRRVTPLGMEDSYWKFEYDGAMWLRETYSGNGTLHVKCQKCTRMFFKKWVI